MRSRRWSGVVLAAVASLAVAVAAPRPAHAERYVDLRGVWLMLGGSFGHSFGRADDGGAYGGELSVVVVDDRRQGQEVSWWGGYLAADHEAGPGTTRLSIGPELGHDFFGVDAAYVLSTGGDGDDDPGTRHGFSVRGLLSVGLVTVYARFETLFGGGAGGEPFGEVGVIAKLPIPLD